MNAMQKDQEIRKKKVKNGGGIAEHLLNQPSIRKKKNGYDIG